MNPPAPNSTRRLAEAVLAQLAPAFPGLKPPWTAYAALPGKIPRAEMEAAAATLARSHSFLSAALRSRYLDTYGSDAFELLAEVKAIADMGAHFGHGLYEIEVVWLVRYEWAANAEDILWRRTKLGLRFDRAQVAALEHWLAEHSASVAGPADRAGA